MHHYNSVVSLQIIICNDIDGENNYGASVVQTCSCTFLHRFSNLVSVLCTLDQLCTLSNFLGKFLCLVFDIVHCGSNTLYVCITVINNNLHETRAKSGLQDWQLHPVGQLVTYTKYWRVAMSLPVTMLFVASHSCHLLLAKNKTTRRLP